MGNPWEIVRNDVSYPIKFYGKLVTGSDGKRHWIGGEDIKARTKFREFRTRNGADLPKRVFGGFS